MELSAPTGPSLADPVSVATETLLLAFEPLQIGSIWPGTSSISCSDVLVGLCTGGLLTSSSGLITCCLLRTGYNNFENKNYAQMLIDNVLHCNTVMWLHVTMWLHHTYVCHEVVSMSHAMTLNGLTGTLAPTKAN